MVLRTVCKTLKILITAVLLATASISYAALSPSYEKGVDPQTSMGKELIDILASYPNMAQISYEVTGDQKFRVPFGPTYWRMLLQPNKIKILFIGQDGTHVAEAAGKTATAGFGGRAQDLAAHFGVRESAGFINAFAPTIYGQYGAFNSPVFLDGGRSVTFNAYVDNQLWLLSQDPQSPLFQWRARLIEWIIRNNKQSLKMIVLFGGAARDVIGGFVESRGGIVGTRVSMDQLKTMKVPLTVLKPAGGNNEFPALIGKNGEDLYEQIMGRKLDYSKEEDVNAVEAAVKSQSASLFEKAAIVPGGLNGSGIVHPAQLGGFDLRNMQISGRRSISLKGLTLSDGSVIDHDVLVVQSPHPTALSMMEAKDASRVVGQALQPVKKLIGDAKAAVANAVQRGETPNADDVELSQWKIEPDGGMNSSFEAGKEYSYARTDLPADYYDFGTPNNRMVSRSDASRLKANVIVIGTRDRAPFDSAKISALTKDSKPADGIAPDELFVTRPRTIPARYQFDPGPGEEFARIMKENLDLSVIGAPKPGMTFAKDGIAAYNIKTHPENVGDFGHYRGTFDAPRVLILADPDGIDDMLTSRALTGARGQYLQSLMNAMGIGDRYLVIKTVPFGMDGATKTEWKTVLAQTRSYREKLLSAILARGKPEMIISDGLYASYEALRILKSSGIPIVRISRNGTENSAGIDLAAKRISSLNPAYKDLKFDGKMANIPRIHLTLLSRIWEGTGGSHVLDSSSPKYKGLAFAVVAPEWAYTQKLPLDMNEQKAVDGLKSRLHDLNLPAPGETAVEFFSHAQ